MGRLYYGNTSEPITVEDGELAHLKVVATAKLRRSEGFAVSFSSAEHGLKLGGVFVDLLQALNQLFCGFGSNGSASFGDRIGVGALLAVRLAHQNQGQACAQALGSGQAA